MTACSEENGSSVFGNLLGLLFVAVSDCNLCPSVAIRSSVRLTTFTVFFVIYQGLLGTFELVAGVTEDQ